MQSTVLPPIGNYNVDAGFLLLLLLSVQSSVLRPSVHPSVRPVLMSVCDLMFCSCIILGVRSLANVRVELDSFKRGK